MSRHEGVSCDSCMKSNFRGRRYKCLICYDYDLCSTCFEGGAGTTRHTPDHPMQCIITRSDFDLFYGGEALAPELPQSFTCPYCSKMGFTEATLQDHVSTDHVDSSIEVVCPVCAAVPAGDPNHVTDDFAAHLALEHRTPRDYDEPPSIRHVRRTPHAGRGMGGMRARRSNMHFSSGTGGLTGLSPSSRESMDPIAELLSQLSSVRSRAAAAQNVSSQLQQLEMQLQNTRQQLERTPRPADSAAAPRPTYSSASSHAMELPPIGGQRTSSPPHSQLLLARLNENQLSESEAAEADAERGNRSLFVQELVLSSLADSLSLNSSDTDDDEPRLSALQGILGVRGPDGATNDTPTGAHSLDGANGLNGADWADGHGSEESVTDAVNSVDSSLRDNRKTALRKPLVNNSQNRISEKDPAPL